MATFCQALKTVGGTGEGERERTILDLHPALAPVKLAILPIVRKDGLAEKANAIYEDLRLDFDCITEERDSIGKRYTRQDLIGTPFCAAVDYQTMEDDTVTIRARNSGEQVRVPISQLRSYVGEQVNIKRILELC